MRGAFIDVPSSIRRELGNPRSARSAPFDFMHWFVADRAELADRFAAVKKRLARDGMLWVSWRKGGTKAQPPCDVSENVIREMALAAGLVDVKVCAVDETWSGLKLVYRLRDR